MNNVEMTIVVGFLLADVIAVIAIYYELKFDK